LFINTHTLVKRTRRAPWRDVTPNWS